MREISRESSPASDPATLIVGAIAAQIIGGLMTQMSPFMIGGLMDGLLLSERDAGLVASIELLTLAAAAIAIAPVLPRLSLRRISLIAVALTLIAQGASIFSGSLASLSLLRGLAGVGEGALYAVSLSIVASRSSNPDRVYGYFQIAWAVGSIALFIVGGQVTAAFAHRGILTFIAGVTLVLAPLLLFIPDARLDSGDKAAMHAGPPPKSLGIMTLAAIFLYIMVSSAIYVFSAPLGERAGLDTGEVGYALTITTLVGLVGAGGATALSLRWGRALPISGFCFCFALTVLALCLSRNPTTYVVALAASGIIFYFSVPYLFGLAAALDRSGRWAAAAGSAYLLGFAAGPLAAGTVITATDYAGLAAIGIAITAVAWALVMVVVRRLGASGATLAADAPA